MAPLSNSSSANSAPDADDTDNEKSPYLVSKNVTVAGRRTSIRLEPYMWDALHHIHKREGVTIHRLCTWIDARKPPHGSLTAAIRVFLLAYFRVASTEKGHEDAGHGHGNPLRNTPFDIPGGLAPSDDERPRGRRPALASERIEESA